MPILGFDTETTGLVNTRAEPTHPSQPHLVQLAAVLMSDDGQRELGVLGAIVRPDGWEIPASAAAVHGITTDLALQVGLPLPVVLAMFNQIARLATSHVAHNVDFDLRVLQAAFHRVGKLSSMHPLNARCTKDLATPVVNLPPTARMLAAGFNKPKPPTLDECWDFLFQEKLTGAHDALVDARGCVRVFFELTRLGRIPGAITGGASDAGPDAAGRVDEQRGGVVTSDP